MPGTTDNFITNEIIVAGLTAAEVWPFLNNTSAWPTYYSNASEIFFHDRTGPALSQGARVRFTTFGFPVEAQITGYEPPTAGTPARIAWHGWVEGDPDTRLDVHHAWLLEDLPGGRVRILTQETQIGKPAQELARTRPNPMLNAHQEWIDGLANAAAKGHLKNQKKAGQEYSGELIYRNALHCRDFGVAELKTVLNQHGPERTTASIHGTNQTTALQQDILWRLKGEVQIS